jgi:hypothetical protein
MYCAFHGEYTLLRRVVPNFIAVDYGRGLPGYRLLGLSVQKRRTAMASCSLVAKDSLRRQKPGLLVPVRSFNVAMQLSKITGVGSQSDRHV